jgi:hypothetical protein
MTEPPGGSLEDILKPVARPDFVYKYSSADRVANILRDLTFYFGAAAPQNDLFEFRVQSLLAQTPGTAQRVFASYLLATGEAGDVEDALNIARTIDQETVQAISDDVIENLNRQLSLIREHSGVTCFSSRRNDQRMWAAYGDNHAGAAIEFTTNPDRSRFASHLSRVLYVNKKLPICPSMLFTEGRLNERLASMLLCVKHTDWRDEEEWRLLLLTDTPQAHADRVVTFERTAITRVFLGPRITREKEDAIRSAADLREPTIPVFKRRIHPELAYEDVVGFEVVRSPEQLAYWMSSLRNDHPDSPPTFDADG